MDAKEKFILEAFGQRITEIRISELQVSQEQMAINCGIHPQHLSLIVHGQKNISLITLRRLAFGSHQSVSQLCNFKLSLSENKYFDEGELF